VAASPFNRFQNIKASRHQVLGTGDFTQVPSAGHDECYGDFSPTDSSMVSNTFSQGRLARMRTSVFIKVSVLAALAVVLPSNADDSCPYLRSRRGLAGYESGGPYKLEHFHLTKGRTDLRDFLWKHWHNRTRGVAEAKVGTVDAGIVTALYVVQPDSQGKWGIDVELGRPLQPPPCSAFRADSLVRFPIRKPDEDYPSQTFGPYLPDGALPTTLLPDSEDKAPKYTSSYS
jgi:hypothetical protein